MWSTAHDQITRYLQWYRNGYWSSTGRCFDIGNTVRHALTARDRGGEAALWAFATTGDFRSGALAAVNLGDDADTTGAIYGQLAGAFYGTEGIPVAWRERVRERLRKWQSD